MCVVLAPLEDCIGSPKGGLGAGLQGRLQPKTNEEGREIRRSSNWGNSRTIAGNEMECDSSVLDFNTISPLHQLIGTSATCFIIAHHGRLSLTWLKSNRGLCLLRGSHMPLSAHVQSPALQLPPTVS